MHFTCNTCVWLRSAVVDRCHLLVCGPTVSGAAVPTAGTGAAPGTRAAWGVLPLVACFSKTVKF